MAVLQVGRRAGPAAASRGSRQRCNALFGGKKAGVQPPAEKKRLGALTPAAPPMVDRSLPAWDSYSTMDYGIKPYQTVEFETSAPAKAAKKGSGTVSYKAPTAPKPVKPPAPKVDVSNLTWSGESSTQKIFDEKPAPKAEIDVSNLTWSGESSTAQIFDSPKTPSPVEKQRPGGRGGNALKSGWLRDMIRGK